MTLRRLQSLWPDNAIWRHRTWSTWSTLIQVMADCHYLNQCWPIINEALLHLSKGNFAGNDQEIYPWYEFKFANIRWQPIHPGTSKLILYHNTNHLPNVWDVWIHMYTFLEYTDGNIVWFRKLFHHYYFHRCFNNQMPLKLWICIMHSEMTLWCLNIQYWFVWMLHRIPPGL